MEIYVWMNYTHSILRWFILLFLVIAITKSLQGMFMHKSFGALDKRVGLFLLIASHTTILIGIYQWIVGSWGLKNIQNLGMSIVMKDAALRFWAVEHMAGMLIAVILITMGKRVGRLSITDRSKHKRSFWFYTIALVIIVASIPWPFREGVGRPLFPHILI